MPWLQLQFNYTNVEIMAWMSIYIPQFYVVVYEHYFRYIS